ncbi:MAG: hypothetical protein IPI18_09040 [Saprospiraceae bacterium]|nr:hypothetical protein [Saprospiraceae bacterium]
MLTNYFKITWRNLIKNPFFSVVNIAGLSVGIAFALIIASYIWSGMLIERFYMLKGNTLFRVNGKIQTRE